MKNIVILIIGILTSCSLLSQDKEIASTIITYWEGQVLDNSEFDFNKNYSWSIKSNYENQLLKERISFGDNHNHIFSITNFEYSDTLLIREIINYPFGDNENRVIKYQYDEKGNQTKRTEYNSKNEIKYDYSFNYDDANLLINQVSMNFLGDTTLEIEYTNNNIGQLLKEVNIEMDGSKNHYLYEYDSNGNQISKKYYSSIGKLEREWQWEYENGKLVEEKYSGNGVNFINIKRYEHLTNLGVVKEITINPGNNSKIRIERTIQNDFGDWIEISNLVNKKVVSIQKRKIKYTL